MQRPPLTRAVFSLVVRYFLDRQKDGFRFSFPCEGKDGGGTINHKTTVGLHENRAQKLDPFNPLTANGVDLRLEKGYFSTNNQLVIAQNHFPTVQPFLEPQSRFEV